MSSSNQLEIASDYLSKFASRRDAFNLWTGTQYITVREPLSPEVVLDALASGRPVGSYFLSSDSTSNVAALDFDRSDGLDLACKVGGTMWADGTPAYVEASRDGRAHLWLGVDARMPGIVLRRAMRFYLAEADVLPAAGDLLASHIELRPGADRLSDPTTLGHALRLPTMPHPITGARFPLVDPRTGEPLGRSLRAMLADVQRVPGDHVLAAAERYVPPPSAATSRPRPFQSHAGSSPIAAFNAAVGCSEVLGREWGVQVRPGGSGSCPYHGDTKNRYLSLNKADSRVWCHGSGDCPMSAGGRGHDAYSLHLLARGQER